MMRAGVVFERAITVAIVGNVVLVLGGLVVDDAYEEWLELAHNVILAVFLIELGIHLRIHGWRFLRSGWNAFDASLILLSLLPALGLDTALLRLGRAARLAHLGRHVLHVLPHLRWLRFAVPAAGRRVPDGWRSG